MSIDLLLRYVNPGIANALYLFRVDTVSLPLANGLILMMYPVLARAKHEELGNIRQAGGLIGLSLLENWEIGLISQSTGPASSSSA